MTTTDEYIAAQYDQLCRQAQEMISADPWVVAVMSNLSALIFDVLPDLNWAGFYLLRDGHLVVGPFQGKPACIHIAVGKGVCGAAVEQDRVQVVADVHQFPGHIACDSASNSEIVLPIHSDGKIRAVLDIDSPTFGRFAKEDVIGLQKLVNMMEQGMAWDR